MLSALDSELPQPSERSVILPRLLDSGHDLSQSVDSLPTSASPQTLDTSRFPTVEDFQQEPTPAETGPQQPENPNIPKIVLTTPCGQQMDIDKAPPWRPILRSAGSVKRDKARRRTNRSTNGSANGKTNNGNGNTK